MACDAWKSRLIDHLYDEIDPLERERVESHLRECEACREEAEGLALARRLIREAEPAAPSIPRVVVLAPRPLRRPIFAFASGVACGIAVLAAALWGGWALATRHAVRLASTVTPVPAGDLVSRAELDRAIQSALANRAPGPSTDAKVARASTAPAGGAALTRSDLDAAFGRFERKMDDRRDADVNYLLREIAASELRTSARIGQTREALRYVALASDPRISAQ